MTRIGARRNAAAASNEEPSRSRERLAQVMTGPVASRRLVAGDHTVQ